MTGMLTTVADEIAAVLQGIDAGQLETAARLIRLTQGAIHCTGQGRSGQVAAMTAMRLMHLGITAHLVGEVTAPAITQRDLLLVVSGSGSTPVSVHYARISRDMGADILAVTRSDSELSRLATQTIAVPAFHTRQPGGNLFEQCALVILDTLGAALAAGIPDAAALLRARHTNLQ